MAKTVDTNEYLWKFELWHEKSSSRTRDASVWADGEAHGQSSKKVNLGRALFTWGEGGQIRNPKTPPRESEKSGGGVPGQKGPSSRVSAVRRCSNSAKTPNASRNTYEQRANS